MPDLFVSLLVTLVVVAATAVYYYLASRRQASSSTGAQQPVQQQQPSSNEPKSTNKKQVETAKKKKVPPKKAKPASAHPRFIRRFRGHHGNISIMSVSPNGEWIATTGVDRQLRISRTEVGSAVFFRANLDESIDAIAWEADNRTVVCVLNHSKEIRFYRMRKKQKAPSKDKFPYELVELVKRRFSIDSNKFDNVSSCLVDQACSSFSVLLTCGDTAAALHQKTKTTVAWDTKEGQALPHSAVMTFGNVRISHDGKLLCGRGEKASKEVKIYEIARKKMKGEIEPRFDKISHKSVMTLIASSSVVDVVLCSDRAVVCCDDGTIQVWNLNVEYRNKEDPKLLCSITGGDEVVAVTASLDGNRIATATSDSSLHLFTYSLMPKPSISLDFSIEGCHPDGVGDIQFCPSGDILYSKGFFDKDVNAWKMPNTK